MGVRNGLRAVPVDDRAWLLAALADALDGGAPVLPVAPGTDPAAVALLRETELPPDTAVLVRTSGSSGVPKTVALSASALLASAAATNDALGGGYGGGQWLVSLPIHLISGLQMLVRSRLAGTEPVFFDGPFAPAALLEAADRMHHARRYVSLVPVQLARLIELAERDAAAAETLRGFAGVLVGGQATSLALRQRAHELGVILHRSYGMTETSGGCVYDGIEVGDTRVRVRDGEVQLGGSCLALGYVGNLALTEARFLTEPGRDGTPVRWYRTGDAGDLLGGMLRVTGRLDRVIVSGGVNVSLDEIERVVGEQPGWANAVAVGVAHPEWGERPVLVAASDRAADPGSEVAQFPQDRPARLPFPELRDLVRDRLGPAAAPDRWLEVDAVPLLPGGKPDRTAIAARVAGA